MTTPSAPHDVSLATQADIKHVCQILASAFKEDPALEWLSGHGDLYYSLFKSDVESLYKHHNHIYINKEQTGAALWLPPGVVAKPPFHWSVLILAWKLVCTGGFKSLKRAQFIDNMVNANQPETPHFYLHAIGASQGNQGRGIGSALIKAGLAVCDQQNLPCYLESSNEKNNPLYKRFGFQVTEQLALPDGGPTIWLMKRPAKLSPTN